MSKRETKKRSKTWIYIRFALIVLAAAVAGGISSILVTSNWEGIEESAGRISSLLYDNGIWLLGTGFVLEALCFFLWLRGDRLVNRAEMEDEAYDRATRLLCGAISLTNIGYVWFFIGLCFTFGGVGEGRGSTETVVLGLFFMIIQIVILTILQTVCIKSSKRLNPEKQGNVFDTRFQKDWYESCDEAEQKRIGDASYFTFKIMGGVYALLMLLMFIGCATFHINALWALLVGGLWLLQIILYQARSYQLENRKQK